MTSDSTEHGGVLVVDLSLEDPLAEGKVVFGGRNLRPRFLGRQKTRAQHLQRMKYLAFAVSSNGFAGDHFEHGSQYDKADVTVFGAAEGIMGERHFDGALQ